MHCIYFLYLFFLSLTIKQIKYRMSNLNIFIRQQSMNIKNLTVEKEIKTKSFEVSDTINKHKKYVICVPTLSSLENVTLKIDLNKMKYILSDRQFHI